MLKMKPARLRTTSFFPSVKVKRAHHPNLHVGLCTNLSPIGKHFSSSSSLQLLQDTPYRFENDPDDQLIRSVFDQPWNHLSTYQTNSNQSTGIFDYPELENPTDLIRVAENTIRRSRLIVNRICISFNPSSSSLGSHQNRPSYSYQQEDPKRAFFDCIKSFDRLSDGLCRIIDLSEVIRNLHSDTNWVNAATHAHSLLCRYMNTLNTHKDLYDALKFTLSRLPSNEEEDATLFAAKTVGIQFLRDFERHGIHLPTESRKKLVELSDEMLKTGRDFFAGSSSESSQPTYVTKSEARMISTRFPENFEEFHHSRHDEIVAQIDPMDWRSHTLLRQHPNQSVRRRIWISQHQSSDQQIHRLESLLHLRSQFAKLTGKSSWSQLVLEDKMINKPENVMKFLSNLNSKIDPIAKDEIKLLEQIKLNQENDYNSRKIQPWDLDYYSNLLKSNRQDQTSRITNFSSYFSVGTCIQGLSRLFKLIYGIHFRVEPIKSKQEIWDESVIKLGVMDENEGRIGTIYCDLFDRSDQSKHHGAAHYTVLCSRRTDLDDEVKDYDFFNEEQDRLDDDLIDHVYPSKDLNQAQFLKVPVVQRKNLPGTYQRPIVVFSCAFDPPDPVSRQPGLLNWSDVETLFHEMGHAMHSMIGQTEYHNVSGTRCATDFVELPSILMERFARSKQVLKLFARHYKDDRRLNLENFEEYILGQRSLLKSLEINSQIVMAALDQHLHSNIVNSANFNSTIEYMNIKQRFGALSLSDQTDRWHGQFGHLYGYGSSYYSYLFDRVISKKIWKEIFDHSTPTTLQHDYNSCKTPSNVLSRENGERFKKSVLVWGGGKNPWHCLAELLNHPSLFSGGDQAVDQVGQWGLWD